MIMAVAGSHDPEAGRYVSPDPLGRLDPARNPAGYVTNPATEADPLGLAPCMQRLEDMAHKISQVLPTKRQRQGQTVAIIATRHKGKDVLVVAGTSKSKLTSAQRKLAEEWASTDSRTTSTFPLHHPKSQAGTRNSFAKGTGDWKAPFAPVRKSTHLPTTSYAPTVF
ncbi:hypothetical protein [Streptomyces sp. NPDC018038]|uniref:hypothetical protein n=1 Tax=Streptomyces sp. NPDC018038 TaxID=3365036 RepID=UPI0037B4FD0C